MPTLLPFVRGGATKKAKSAAKSAASGSGSGTGSSGQGGGMQAFQKRFGGGGQKPGPEEAAQQLAGKRLIPGQGLPHVVLHTVQVS